MHELAITEAILKIALSEAEKHGAKRVLTIKLCLGAYSDVEIAYVQKYFPLAGKNSIAEGARIQTRRAPARIRCKSCERESLLQKGECRCPSCQSTAIELLSGMECFVESIEVE